MALLQGDAMRFDVVIDESPASPNAKERNWALMQPLMPTILGMDMPPEAKLELFKASPVPASVLESIERIIKESEPQQQEQQQKQQQIAEGAATAKIERDKAAAAKDMALAEQTQAETKMAGAELGMRMAEAEVGMVERPMQRADEREATSFDRQERQASGEREERKLNGANGSGIGMLPMMMPPQPPPSRPSQVSQLLQPSQPPQAPPPRDDAVTQALVAAMQEMAAATAAMVENAQRPRRIVRDEGGNILGSEVV
jgi:hypothetical protein